MTGFLLFTLYAPLSSWGEIAVGEARTSWDRPSRSAILGLVAAALGIRRDDQARHDALDAGMGFAVRLEVPGRPLVDYHTAQTVAQTDARRSGAVTRAQLLRAGDPQTILSRRHYRQDGLSTVSLWSRVPGAIDLQELADALSRPVFTLYAGRKANPFGLPLDPAIIETATLREAFVARLKARENHAFDHGLAALWNVLRPRGGWGREVAYEEDSSIQTGLDAIRQVRRRDGSPQRLRWHFSTRTANIALLPPDSPAALQPA